MKPTCVIIQRFDDGYYDRLCREIFEPSIIAAGYESYRVDNDASASIPIEEVESRINDAAACFGELSEDNPNVWYEVGYAAAKDKALCLVCSYKRSKFPFDVQHRKIIRYPANASPSQHIKLGHSITSRLTAILSTAQSAMKSEERQKADEILSSVPSTNGLRPHEMVALATIFQDQHEGGTSAYQLANDMQKGGYTKIACSIALTMLQRAELVQFRTEVDWNGNESQRLFVSRKGEDWIISNQDTLALVTLPLTKPSSLQNVTSEDDIPF